MDFGFYWEQVKDNSYIENRVVVAKGERVGEGWSGRLVLGDVNYYI